MSTVLGSMTPDEALASLFFTDEGIEDPSPLYHHLRSAAPIHRSATGAVFLSRYDDCRQVLRDNRLGKGTRDGDSLIPSSDPGAAAFRRAQRERLAGRRPMSMLFLDPPEHTRQRSLVARAFTPRRVEQLRARIRALADRVVDDFVAAAGRSSWTATCSIATA